MKTSDYFMILSTVYLAQAVGQRWNLLLSMIFLVIGLIATYFGH